MKKDFFAQLYETDYNLNRLIVMRQSWNNGHRFVMNHPRPTHGFLLFDNCEAICEQGGKQLHIPRGALVHTPEGSEYSWRFLSEEDAAHPYLFEFSLATPEGKPIRGGHEVSIVFENQFDLYEKYFLRLLDEFSRPRPSPAAIKSAAYRLLTNVAQKKYRENAVDVNTRMIAKGITYLEEDTKQEKSVAEIAEMCNVSINYFERLFKLYAGETPIEYRLRLKMERAQLLIGMGGMSVGQIAEELGFADTAYFSRLFRKKVGITPKEYRALHQNNEKKGTV